MQKRLKKLLRKHLRINSVFSVIKEARQVRVFFCLHFLLQCQR